MCLTVYKYYGCINIVHNHILYFDYILLLCIFFLGINNAFLFLLALFSLFHFLICHQINFLVLPDTSNNPSQVFLFFSQLSSESPRVIFSVNWLPSGPAASPPSWNAFTVSVFVVSCFADSLVSESQIFLLLDSLPHFDGFLGKVQGR